MEESGYMTDVGREERGAAWTHRGTLSAPAEHASLATVGVGPDGLPIALWTRPEDAGTLHEREDRGPDSASFPRTRPTRPPRAAVTRHTTTGSLESVVLVNDVRVSHPFIQPLRDGEFVIAGSRAAWRPEGPERNLHHYSSSGDLIAAWCIGDGIAHLQTDAPGRIWAGYFDEGVYGNFGWGRPGPPPLALPASWPGQPTAKWSGRSTPRRAPSMTAMP